MSLHRGGVRQLFHVGLSDALVEALKGQADGHFADAALGTKTLFTDGMLAARLRAAAQGRPPPGGVAIVFHQEEPRSSELTVAIDANGRGRAVLPADRVPPPSPACWEEVRQALLGRPRSSAPFEPLA